MRASGSPAAASGIHESKKLNLIEGARLYALMAVARADALIAVFDAKYHYDFWRPVTAIRNGDMDDNPATERDATWTPIAETPMHPEYPCAHCTLAGSMTGVVEALFGTADVREVSTTSPTLVLRRRNFLHLAAGAASLPSLQVAAWSQPSRTLEVPARSLPVPAMRRSRPRWERLTAAGFEAPK
jgi:hypothetical protein